MKLAIITGAASGIGLALTQIYLKGQAKVLMVDKDTLKLQQTSQSLLEQFPGQVITAPCDIRQETQVRNLVSLVKDAGYEIHWIYNNAGIIGNLDPIWESPIQTIQEVMDVNLFGMIYMIQAFMPLLLEQNFRGHIVNMASMYALCSSSQTTAYAMSKHAVLALSESLYFDLKRLDKPVDISVVFPSFTDTSLMANSSSPSGFQKSLASLLTHSRSAEDLALQVIAAVDKKQFYIFPDKEVKIYAEERVQAMITQEAPQANAVEKLMHSLIKRVKV